MSGREAGESWQGRQRQGKRSENLEVREQARREKKKKKERNTIFKHKEERKDGWRR